MKNLLVCAAALSAFYAVPAQATVGYADTVIDFFDSGAGPIAGPYGGTSSSSPIPVSTSVVLGPDNADQDFLSLPTGSYVTVGFTDETVTDGLGDDIFISEVGSGGEQANIYVSGDGSLFQLLGVANNSTVTSFDLASIGFVGTVAAVRVEGLDAGGSSPGFDLNFVQVLPGAFTAVPEPSTWAMMLLGLGAIGVSLRRRKQSGLLFAE